MILPRALKLRSLQLRTDGFPCQKIEEEVALEAPIAIRVNGKHFATLFATPFQQRELALGHLLGEGIIKTIEEISDVDVKEGEVDVSVSTDISERFEAAHAFRIRTTECGSVDDFYTLLDQLEKPTVNSEYQTTPEYIAAMVSELNRRSTQNKTEMALHAAAIFSKGDVVAYAEDAGRHNTVDKTIGICLEKRVNFSESIIVTTGRQASDMVLKAARAAIPITVAIRGALYSGIFAAWKTKVTLIARARGSSMRVYTYPERILNRTSGFGLEELNVDLPTEDNQSAHHYLKPDMTVDMRDLLCPAHVQKLAEVMKTVDVGQLIEVIAADPMTLVDIPAWAFREKQLIVGIKDYWLTIKFYIKRAK